MRKFSKKIGFIGYGNMASSIIEGFTNSKVIKKSSIFVFEKRRMKAGSNIFKSHLLKPNQNFKTLFDIVFLCVKPQDFKSAIKENSRVFREGQIVISIIAGVSTNDIKDCIGKKVHVVRTMPNLSAKIHECITVIFYSRSLPKNFKKLIDQMFSLIGITIKVNKEDQINNYTALTGSGPAYIYYFFEALENSCKKLGIKNSNNRDIIYKMLVGSLELLKKKDGSIISPEKMRKLITSKGGTTESAINQLKRKKFNQVVNSAIQVAHKKSLDLGKKIK
ncbi:MAG: pyrroline-5-carboxylate reductase [Gammaproteobacteria bacterium]|nr:pyrroline-5-carboxylate reductase [Gammaproteobacteria bacterium]|tara:strand:+ start:148 stop:978 length:831 start_codon:yes stop_codon:yes gene_type:complete